MDFIGNITIHHGLALTVVLCTLVFSRLVANFIINQAKRALNSQNTLDSFRNPLSFALIIMGLYAASLLLVLTPEIHRFLHKAIKYLVTITVLWALYNALTHSTVLIEKVGTKLSDDLKIFVLRMAKVLVFFLATMATLQLWVDDVPAFIGGLGLIGIAVALAAQDTLKNLFGSITILFDKTFQKGDLIKINNIEGEVAMIGIRTTIIKDSELGHVVIPNSTIINSPIINYSRRPSRLIEWKISVRSSTKNEALDSVIEAMRKWIAESPLVEQGPKNYVFLDSFKNGMIDIHCQFFSKSPDRIEYFRVKDAAIRAFRELFEKYEVNISVPYHTVVLASSEDE